MAWLLTAAALLTGCQNEAKTLQLADLTPAEHRYVERFVVLERARAVAMVDAPSGLALLDSLAVAWGPGSMTETGKDLPQRPQRISALHDLLARILEAESDSLLQAPLPRRLGAALPDPPPRAVAP
jgi:hypothetical protein